MKRALTRLKAEGLHEGIAGDLSGVWGDMSLVSGDMSGVRGDLDGCEISEEERSAGVSVADLILDE